MYISRNRVFSVVLYSLSLLFILFLCVSCITTKNIALEKDETEITNEKASETSGDTEKITESQGITENNTTATGKTSYKKREVRNNQTGVSDEKKTENTTSLIDPLMKNNPHIHLSAFDTQVFVILFGLIFGFLYIFLLVRKIAYRNKK